MTLEKNFLLVFNFVFVPLVEKLVDFFDMFQQMNIVFTLMLFG